MDPSAPTCMWPWVRIPKEAQLLRFAFQLYCEKDENKQKGAGIGPYLKYTMTVLSISNCSGIEHCIIGETLFITPIHPFQLLFITMKFFLY